MYWNGKNETTEEELRSIYQEQFDKWGVFQVWTDKPEHYLEVDYTPEIYVVVYSMDDFFDTIPINNCLSNDQYEWYGIVRVESICTLDYVDLSGYTLIWEDGDWVDANKRTCD